MVTVPTLVTRLYPRLGPRYLGFALYSILTGGIAVGVAGVAVLALYIDTSLAHIALLLATVELFWVLDMVLALRLGRDRLRPVARWLEGERGERETTAAWRAIATLPFELARHRPFYMLVSVLAPLWDVYAVWLLDLPAFAVPVLVAGNVLIYAYWVVLRFLAVERVLRPVLVEIAEGLPRDAVLPAITVPLGTRLALSLPPLLVITGAVAPGLAAHVHGDVARLATGIGAAVVVAFTLGGGVIELLVLSIVAPIRQLRQASKRVGDGDFSARVPVTSADESGDLARSFNHMVEGLEERERLRETFGAYVDPEVAKHILEHGTDLGGEQVDVTVMFLDVRDFTGYAESALAPEVVTALNRLWERVVPVVHEHAGHVDKFVGDGLLAVFGAPRRCDDHADQALAAALEIAERTRDGSLRIGIGLNTGTVVAGNVGAAGRLEFSVIGDAVNVAARVESATRRTGDTILVTEATRRALTRPDAVALAPRPDVPLKGKTEPIRLYAPATGAAPAAATSAASAARRPA